MSDREYDELINKLEAIIYPIVFVVVALNLGVNHAKEI